MARRPAASARLGEAGEAGCCDGREASRWPSVALRGRFDPHSTIESGPSRTAAAASTAIVLRDSRVRASQPGARAYFGKVATRSPLPRHKRGHGAHVREAARRRALRRVKLAAGYDSATGPPPATSRRFGADNGDSLRDGEAGRVDGRRAPRRPAAGCRSASGSAFQNRIWAQEPWHRAARRRPGRAWVSTPSWLAEPVRADPLSKRARHDGGPTHARTRSTDRRPEHRPTTLGRDGLRPQADDALRHVDGVVDRDDDE
jgi:hypothetical protein